MTLYFPANPTVGQRYSAGGFTWEWNGQGWIILTAFGDAPSNGKHYGRVDGTWGEVAPRMSPILGGNPQLETSPVSSDNDKSIATTEFVNQAIANALASMGGDDGISGWSTGDAKLTLKSVADAGWLIMDDSTIGSALSGAAHALDATQPLFTLLFNAPFNDTVAPLLTSAGAATNRAAFANAAAAWAANARLTLTRQLGRSITIAGAGAGLTTHGLGSYDGAETHTQTGSELANHGHGVGDPTHIHYFVEGLSLTVFWNFVNDDYPVIANYNSFMFNPAGTQLTNQTGAALTGVTVAAAGGSSPMSITPPRSYWNVMIKL
jgi:hypothetical protein